MKNFTLLISLFFFALFGLQKVTAQIEVCQTKTLKLGVDTGDSATGTPGSTYAWTITTSTLDGTYVANANKIEIDFASSDIGKTFTIMVIENNGDCDGDPQEYLIKVVAGPSTPTISATTPICEGESAVFVINGTAGNIVIYTLDGGTTTAEIEIGTDGTAEVSVPSTVGTHTIQLSNVASNNSAAACSVNIDVSAIIVVNARPVTSSITPL